MNQILNFNDNNNTKYYNKKLKSYKIIFLLSIIICILSIIIYFFIKYNSNKNDKISKKLVNNFSLTTLYSNSIGEYSATQIDVVQEPFVIGLIKIDKINLVYPILSQTTPELLKLSPCRYFGPMPNEIRQSMYCWS